MAKVLVESASLTMVVLGCGFVGEQLLRQCEWGDSSCFTTRLDVNKNLNYQQKIFDIDVQQSWQNLPFDADILLITLPTSGKSCDQERQRLELWCRWMQAHRPNIRRVIYISTTGVYSETPVDYDEDSRCEPDTLRGELRLVSEQVLSTYFDCISIRCGGIYGHKRNVVSKILAGKAIFAGNKKMYRIHVEDLANIVALIAVKWPQCAVFHGVDHQSASQDEVIVWLQQQSCWQSLLADKFTLQQKRLDEQQAENRTIAQQKVLSELGYQLKYPTFDAGLAAILTDLQETSL